MDGYGYDKATLKNYAATMSMYWPGLDTASYNSAYSQASRVPSVVAKVEGGQAGLGPSPQAGSSPPFQHTAPPTATATVAAHLTPTAPIPPGPQTAAHTAPALASFQAGRSAPVGTPKKKPQAVPQHMKDPAYYERRRRNNESARRSRETRRIKEDQTHYKLLYLENENLNLRTELSMMRAEVDRLRLLLGNAQLQAQPPAFPPPADIGQ